MIRVEIDKMHQKIDKIAKVGRDNYANFYQYIDEVVRGGKYGVFSQTLALKYNIIVMDKPLDTVKKESWKEILYQTNTPFQDSYASLLKRKGIYQVGLFYYYEIGRTRVNVIDTSGSGAILVPVTEDGKVTSITVVNGGTHYSSSTQIVITGGYVQATAVPIIRGGKIYAINVTYGGCSHNRDVKIGVVREHTSYVDQPGIDAIYSNEYQKKLRNKAVYVSVSKDGVIYTDFTDWVNTKSYDWNLLAIYEDAIDYLLSLMTPCTDSWESIDDIWDDININWEDL